MQQAQIGAPALLVHGAGPRSRIDRGRAPGDLVHEAEQHRGEQVEVRKVPADGIHRVPPGAPGIDFPVKRYCLTQSLVNTQPAALIHKRIVARLAG